MTPSFSGTNAEGVAEHDFVVLRLAVTGLILMGLVAVAGSLVLNAWDKTVPDGIIAMGSAAIGALSTMLVRTQAPS